MHPSIRGMALPVFALIMLAIILGPAPLTAAQDDRPTIAYVIGHREGEYRNALLSGFSRLTIMMDEVNARVQEIELNEPVPDDIDLLILNGPKNPAVSVEEISRIWSYVERGGNLLILNDPRPNFGLTEFSGLNALLWQDYGIRWRGDSILERWFNDEVALSVTRLGFQSQPRRVVGISAEPLPRHPISNLAYEYKLAVYYWLGTSLEVQSPAIRGNPVPLLRARTSPFGDTPFGETSFERGQPVFDAGGNAEFNIGEDTQGELILGAAVENPETGARIVVMGDSDLFKNGYGLEFAAGTDSPLYGGNSLLAQGTIRWLLDLPMDDISYEPDYVWIAVDGSNVEWEEIDPAYESNDQFIEVVKFVRSDRANYLMIEYRESDTPISAVFIDLFDSSDNLFRISLQGSLRVAHMQAEEESNNRSFLADTAIDNVIEVRLPLDAFPVGELYSIQQICVMTDQNECAGTSIGRPARQGMEPRGRVLVPNILTARVNALVSAELLTEPTGVSLAMLEDSTLVNVFEISEDGIWARIGAESLQGWIRMEFLQLAFDPSGPVQ